jgi:hypothetical protein
VRTLRITVWSATTAESDDDDDSGGDDGDLHFFVCGECGRGPS